MWQTSQDQYEEFSRTGHLPGQLIRPLGALEIWGYKHSLYQSANTVQGAWISSKSPINPQDLFDAVKKVALKTEILQLCISETFFDIWLRKMDRFVCDFDVIYHNDAVQVFCDLLQEEYDMKTGPLWKARLVILPEITQQGSSMVLFLSIHHIVTDAASSALLYRDIISIINARIQEKIVDIPFRSICPSAESLLKTTSIQCKLEALQDLAKTVRSICKNRRNPFNLFRPEINLSKVKLGISSYTYSQETTEKILLTCKENKVSFNCFMVAIANICLLKLLSHYDKNCKKVLIVTGNIANLRRYLDPQYGELLGFFASGHEINLKVTKKDLENISSFWNLAKKVSSIQERSLASEVPIQRLKCMKFMHYIAMINRFLSSKHRRNFAFCHITVNNMGDLNKQYFGNEDSDPVYVVDYLRSTWSPYSPIIHCLNYQTITGRISISLEQFSSKCNTELSKELFGYIIELITTTIEDSSLNAITV